MENKTESDKSVYQKLINANIKKRVSLKIFSICLTIALIISLFFNLQYSELLKSRAGYEYQFLNTTGSTLYSVISDINELKEYYTKKDFSDLELRIAKLNMDLVKLETSLDISTSFADNEIQHNARKRIDNIYETINGTLELSNINYQDGFSEDNVLSENEYTFLVDLSDEMKKLVDPIFSLGNLQVRKDAKISDYFDSLYGFAVY